MPTNGIPTVMADLEKGNEKVEWCCWYCRGRDADGEKNFRLVGCGRVRLLAAQRAHLVRSVWPTRGHVVGIVFARGKVMVQGSVGKKWCDVGATMHTLSQRGARSGFCPARCEANEMDHRSKRRERVVRKD
jgi:hypothetical protein